HAGTYDPFDFLTKKGMQVWGKDLENSWLQIVDKIFMATKFHKQLLEETRTVDPNKVIVTGHPMYHMHGVTEKENICVFPHRLDSEKQPELFDEMASILKEE